MSLKAIILHNRPNYCGHLKCICVSCAAKFYDAFFINTFTHSPLGKSVSLGSL